MKTEISKQDAIKYLERKSFPGWDACSDKPTVSLSDAKYLIDLIYSHGNCGMMDVRISLYGCDDATYIDTDVTAEEYDFLLKLKRLSKENSDYACQPTLNVEIIGERK